MNFSDRSTYMSRPHFVTGQLAAASLRKQLERLAPRVEWDGYTVEVLPITVAALMTVQWIADRIEVPEDASCVIIPGYCLPENGDLSPLANIAQRPTFAGPRDLHGIDAFFGKAPAGPPPDYGAYDIDIIAEINHAPRMSAKDILGLAQHYHASGADVIDIGCDPSQTWSGIGDCVRSLRDAGYRVSVDSMNPIEVQSAAQAGAELVLSVNAANRNYASDWGCEVVVVPDDPKTLAGLDESIDFLEQRGVPYRIDPILEPIAFGFAASVGRYLEVRRRYPAARMMMGIGNLTELTDCDSAGINVLLLGLCQELEIRSVLTTEVINWARSSVRECNAARRMLHYAVSNARLPKHLEPDLVMLRDPWLTAYDAEFFQRLAEDIRDPNYRLFADGSSIHVVTSDYHDADSDPFLVFERMLAASPRNIDAEHAFYLGFEMCKAAVANALGKQYEQDESLRWGMLTVQEDSHRLRRTARARQGL